MMANAHTKNPCHDNLEIAALSAGAGEILVRKSMFGSGSEQPDILGPCIVPRVAMVDLIDLRSRVMLGHGGERLADRREYQRDASKNRAAAMDASPGHGISLRDTMAMDGNP